MDASQNSSQNVCSTSSGPSAATSTALSSCEPELCRAKGHVFIRRTYHKPTYCHYCSDLLWGILNQGFSCIICNMISHERCLKGSSLPLCLTNQYSSIKVPAPHSFIETKVSSRRRLFCSVCRRKLDERYMLQCERKFEKYFNEKVEKMY